MQETHTLCQLPGKLWPYQRAPTFQLSEHLLGIARWLSQCSGQEELTGIGRCTAGSGFVAGLVTH